MGCKDTHYIYSEKKKFFLKEDIEFIYNRVVSLIQKEDLSQSSETFTTILSELIQNAMKANSKKVILGERFPLPKTDFFIESKDGDEVLYRFRDDIDYSQILRNSNHWIQVFIYLDGTSILAKVVNSSPLSSNEKFRIHRVVDLASEGRNFLELCEFLSPRAELGGIGLAMSFRLLQAESLPIDLIQIERAGDITYASFEYPHNPYSRRVSGTAVA